MERIGRFEIEEELGRGAMGRVYLARDPRMRRRLAVKTYELPPGIDPELAREYRKRFIREAQSAGALNHPAIVTIYDVEEDPVRGTSFIAMEYIPGNSLRDCLRDEGRLAPERAVLLGTCVADALHAAHAAGIVHRDIKPSNILVRHPDGAFKIADFGIARHCDSELTQAGITLGSPAYMSPEQLRSDEIDGRSDLFSLAGVVYEALSGRPPFEGNDLPSLAYSVVHRDPVPVSSLVRELPVALDAFFDRALAKSPEDRFQDGLSFAAALDEAWERREGACFHPVTDDAAVSLSRPETDGAEATDSAGQCQTARGYRPRSPGQVLQRAQVEQTLSELPIIPLARDTDGPPTSPRMQASRRTDPHARAATEQQAPLPPPRRRRWPARLLILAALLAATVLWVELPVADPASVVLDVTSNLPSGTLTILLDGQRVYRGSLAALSGAAPTVPFTIPPGEHMLQVRVRPEGVSRSYQNQVKINARTGETHRLTIVTGNSENATPAVRFR